MIDGLALGETTPGPLIMVVSFVGFVGAWTKEISARMRCSWPASPVPAWRPSSPSCRRFLFILAGAPLVEATHGDLKFTAPLTGITAAVVGVILNLALFFGWHVIWPQATEAAPFSGGFEWFYALISHGRLHRPVEIQAGHHEGHRRLRRCWGWFTPICI